MVYCFVATSGPAIRYYGYYKLFMTNKPQGTVQTRPALSQRYQAYQPQKLP